MGIENFGKVSFTSETKAADFVTYLEKGRVMASRCKKCGTRYFPPRADCPGCLSSDVELVEITGTAKLATYTSVEYGPTGFEDDSPYTLGVAAFKEGLQVFGRISRDINRKGVRVGMAVKVVPVKLAGGRLAYEFQAV